MQKQIIGSLEKIVLQKEQLSRVESELVSLLDEYGENNIEKSVQNKKEILVLQKERYCELIDEEIQKLLNSSFIVEETIKGEQQKIFIQIEEIEKVNTLRSKANRILQLIKDIECLLLSAKKYSIWDMIGGGLFSDAIKNEKLEQAQEMIKTLEQRIREFEKESEQIRIDVDIKVKSEGLLRFSDYLFDDIFSAIRVKKNIDSALMRLRKAEDTFQKITKALSKKHEKNREELERNKEKFCCDLLEVYGEKQ